MEKLTIEATLNEISQAYATLEVAKEECTDVVKSALDAHLGDTPQKPDKVRRMLDPGAMDEYKKAMRARKTEAKNIIKLAKAMMKGAKEVAKEEADNMTSLIESLG